jgi:hypothetical protein
MPRETYKSERHYALEDFCCNGDCSQGRACPRDPRPESSHLTLSDLLLAVGIVGAFGGVIFAGPMFQDFLRGLVS